MTKTKTCPKCATELPDNAPSGICPRCLMQAGLESEQRAGSASEINPTTPTSGFVPPEPDTLARHFPHLEILESLGHGGMGAVYKARQIKLDRLVALKIIRPESADDPAFAERFHREARTLARLGHPNIVGVHDFGEVMLSAPNAEDASPRTLYYLLMEYIDGASVRQLIDAGELEPDQAIAIVPQICEALQFAHDEGVVHRDIKPENILLDQRGRVKIADFGLAKLASLSEQDFTLTGTGQVMGTPRYMAPEQMEGSHAVDHRADIYSLGVVFYEMLTGQVPAGHFDPPSKKVRIDVRLDEVVLRSLAREPERRYQQASEIRMDVETISHSSAPVGAPASAPTGAAAVHEPTSRQPAVRQGTAEDLVAIRSELEAPSLTMMVLGLLMAMGHWITIVWCLQSSWDAETAWIGLPGVIVGTVMFCGGLSLRTLWSSGWAHLGAISALIPAGPGWLITAFIGIWILNVLGRPHIRSAFTDRSRRAAESMEPRFSRKAVTGACWAPFFFATLLSFVLTSAELRSPVTPSGRVAAERRIQTIEKFEATTKAARESSSDPVPSFRPTWWQWALIISVLPLGMTAPFGTTILGFVSISDIRHSQGRLTGLPLAVADAVLFPVLLLDGLVICLFGFLCVVGNELLGAQTAIHQSAKGSLLYLGITALLSIPTCAYLDYRIVRAAWRRASGQSASTHSESPGTFSEGKSGFPWLLFLAGNSWLLAAIVLLLGKKVARTQPLMYSFFNIGGWLYPGTYHALLLFCAGIAGVCFALLWRSKLRRNSQFSSGHVARDDSEP